MKYRTIFTHDPFGPENNEHQESSKEIVLRDMTRYPNNSILHKDVYNKLLKNLNKIPIAEIEKLLIKFNCL